MKYIVPFLLVTGCVSSTSDMARSIQEENIREAVFRYQFGHNASGLQKHAAVYCLSTGQSNADPSEELMKRFTNHNPPVRKISQCQTHPSKGVIDELTGAHGLSFRVSSITWISSTQAEVEGGYYEAGLSASGNTYTVVKLHGTWKISRDRMNWIAKRSISPSSIPS